MRELGSMLAAVALFFGLLLALMVAWALYWFHVAPLVVPPLSPVLAFVRGLPDDTRFWNNFKDGTGWVFCRDLPSGRATFTDRNTLLEHGRRCEPAPPASRDLSASLEPAFTVSSSSRSRGWMHFALPEVPGLEPSARYPYALEPSYIRWARALLEEASTLPDVPDERRRSLLAAKKAFAGYSGERLSGIGGSCSLPPPKPIPHAD